MARYLAACLCVVLAGGTLTAQEPKEPALAKELTARVKADQDARKELITFLAEHNLTGKASADPIDPAVAERSKKLLKAVEDLDTSNTAWLKEVVGKHGWPGKSLVGTAGAQDAWLLVQHADRDRDFQDLCLGKMRAMAAGEVEPRNLAYLTDRVLVGRGKKQTYGTQAKIQDGKAVPAPIEDEAGVDERRKAMGLEPLAEYLKSVEAVYTKPKPAEPKGKDGGR
jgi:hypothetical protein